MTPSAPILHAVSTTASAAALALALGFFPAGPALAAATAPSPTPASDTQAPDCGLVCVPILAGSPDPGQTSRPRKSRDPVPPPSEPAPPAGAPAPTAQPVQPQQGQPDIAPPDPAQLPASVAPDPGGAAATESASATAGYRPPTGPSSGQDWNSPVTRSSGPTQMAAVAPAGGEGPGGPALGPIALGTLLVGTSAGAFAVWNRNRNRLRSH